MDTFSFCRESRKKLSSADHYIERFRLTNSVLHVNTQNCGDQIRSRDVLFSRNFNEKGVVRTLNELTNDNQAGPNYRLDLECGRLLSFMRAGNHIRAGKASPADAVASVYKFHALVLNSDTDDKVFFPDQLLVPNIVATGTLKGPVSKTLDACGLVNSSSKFPGKSITLNTNSTPVVYPNTHSSEEGCGKNFIMPGILSVDQCVESVNKFSEIVTGTY